MKKYDKKLGRREWFINEIWPVIAYGLEKYSVDLNSDGRGRLGEFGKVEKLNDNEREEFINGEINDLKESLDDWLKGICEIDYVRAEKSTSAILYVEIKNQRELCWRAGEVYDENIEEPYGEERQKIELLKDIEEKYKKLGNKTMFLKIGLLYDIDDHLKLFEALKELEKEGLAKTEDNFLKANSSKIEGITITIADKLIKTFNEEKEDKARIITDGLRITCHNCERIVQVIKEDEIKDLINRDLKCQKCGMLISIQCPSKSEMLVSYRVKKEDLLKRIKEKSDKQVIHKNLA